MNLSATATVSQKDMNDRKTQHQIWAIAVNSASNELMEACNKHGRETGESPEYYEIKITAVYKETNYVLNNCRDCGAVVCIDRSEEAEGRIAIKCQACGKTIVEQSVHAAVIQWNVKNR